MPECHRLCIVQATAPPGIILPQAKPDCIGCLYEIAIVRETEFNPVADVHQEAIELAAKCRLSLRHCCSCSPDEGMLMICKAFHLLISHFCGSKKPSNDQHNQYLLGTISMSLNSESNFPPLPIHVVDHDQAGHDARGTGALQGRPKRLRHTNKNTK